MLDIKFVTDNKQIVQKAITNKKVKMDVDLDEVIALAEERKGMITELDVLKTQRNEIAKERDIEKGRKIKEKIQELETRFRGIDDRYTKYMLALPNIPSADTPIGEDENQNVVLKTVGKKREFDFKPKPHWEFAEENGWIDKERAAVISGSRFAFLMGDLVLLQFALIRYCFDTLTNESKLSQIAKNADLDISAKPFIPVLPPVFIKPEVFDQMGRLHPADQRYYIQEDDLYLIGSAEHTLGPLHLNHIFEEKDLPIRYIGYSTSFRREAGTYGKDTRGIIRMHQFDKLEMESFCLPENSYKEQDFFVAIQEYLVNSLGIPYQVIAICTGDMGIPDHRQIDINAWMPGQEVYKETHTSDLMTTFQSRRLNARYRNSENKLEYVHMNDATAYALGRTLVAIMENYQREDGLVDVPEVLKHYIGKDTLGKVK
jgi:seryl-tRNA synthetase